MSVTVRRWTPAELERVTTDNWLATLLMNGGTFSQEEMRHYPYTRRKSYIAEFEAEECDDVRFYATDDDMALRFLQADYDLEGYPLASLREVITTLREVRTEVTGGEVILC